MNKITIAALAVSALFLTGCDHWLGIRGNGHIVTDNRAVGNFTELEAGGAFDIEWRSGPPALSITTDENLLQYIDNRIVDHRLRLRSHENLRPTHSIKVLVTSPTRSAAKLTGACRLSASDLTGARFALETTGAAKVTLDGNVDELLAETTGASKLNAGGLQTKVTKISTSGAAKADVAVSQTLKVSITGAGRVVYNGNPPTIEKHVAGAGVIEHKE
jgi:Putative auto-transporter adhesin, head GIN domain